MNVILKGKTKQVVMEMVEQGYANTQSEAIRMALVEFGDEHLSHRQLGKEEARLVAKAVTRAVNDIKSGKVKTIPAEEVFRKAGLQ